MKNENVIFENRPSQWVNAGHYFFMAVLVLPSLIVVLAPNILTVYTGILGVYASAVVFTISSISLVSRYLKTRFTSYKLTTERLFVKTGILSRKTNELELYRVKDYQHDEPFFLRLVRKSNIGLVASDRTNRVVWLRGVSDGEKLSENIRDVVEARRDAKGVREFDMQTL